ncbi:CLUMA_CG020613, isoform A [Clunio marinus]|uniref:CLUMA_CG020613, isoform A n=1 Tax=Clunio marinus TaxID=568069 RepID=A0A1J1J849_9DIPT|nr:CLUMA_CG020613, isoform A [Clunio marinus]
MTEDCVGGWILNETNAIYEVNSSSDFLSHVVTQIHLRKEFMTSQTVSNSIQERDEIKNLPTRGI